MTLFAATPGTWLIHHDEDIQPTPIIGWSTEGSQAFPVTPLDIEPMTGHAYWLPSSGVVIDPGWGKTFESDEAWRAAYHREVPYEAGEPLRASGKAAPAKGKAAPAKPAPEREKPGPEPVGMTEEQVAAVNELSWGTKQYKNKSYWMVETDDPDGTYLFELGGSMNCPNDDLCKKITRDEYFERRKSLPYFKMNPDVLVSEEDDDDADDLI